MRSVFIMDRKKRIFGYIAISVVLVCFFNYTGIQKIQSPKLKAPHDMAIGSNKIFVIKKDRAVIGLRRNLSFIQPQLQIEKDSPGNQQLIENKFDTKPEVRHIAFLKVHKAASSTIQNIMFRFGYLRNLSFVLPVHGHYFSRSSQRHVPLIPPQRDGHYDILCLHAIFNYSVYSTILPKDTVYIASVREPWTQFNSAVNYYTSVFHFDYLQKIPGNKIENLIRYPEIYEKRPLSYTMNSMGKDFGFTMKHYQELNSSDDANSTIEYLDKLGSIFEFVLIKEQLEESLLILKRRLGWSMKDILFVSKKVINPDVQISQKLMEQFRKRNKLDFIIYEYFFRKFEEEKKKYGDDLIPETENFKTVLARVNDWCVEKGDEELIIEATKWNKQFSVTKFDCGLLDKKSLQFLRKVRKMLN